MLPVVPGDFSNIDTIEGTPAISFHPSKLPFSMSSAQMWSIMWMSAQPVRGGRAARGA